MRVLKDVILSSRSHARFLKVIIELESQVCQPSNISIEELADVPLVARKRRRSMPGRSTKALGSDERGDGWGRPTCCNGVQAMGD